ncbi:hypothetical protein [Bradyrhizobium sp. CCBAU 51753]|uniref:hypothetical protein n=1 Tax=Bradyrhizobium sp. CCBAU 51753 TaxID=1325100 RepID=UPI001889E37F|nr:hypothetical protein [Bradyrhizobium sp. CCBAU 51753]
MALPINADEVTPDYGSQIVLDQLPPLTSVPRLKLVVISGESNDSRRDASGKRYLGRITLRESRGVLSCDDGSDILRCVHGSDQIDWMNERE